MARHIPRIFIDTPLALGVAVELAGSPAHHIRNVLRMDIGGKLSVFNGVDGAWGCHISAASKRQLSLVCETQIEEQPNEPQKLNIFLAGLKKQRFHWAVEKLTEIGVTDIVPTITEHTQTRHFQVDKLERIAIEACEQCGSLNVPNIHEPHTLSDVLARDFGQVLIPDEDSVNTPLPHLIEAAEGLSNKPISLIIGPEGGFTNAERNQFNAHPKLSRVGLGSRILRSETAAIVAAAHIVAKLS